MKADHSKEIDGLNAENARLKATMNQRAREIADDAIRSANLAVADSAKATEAAVRATQRQIGEALSKVEAALPTSFYDEVTDALGKEAASIFSRSNREARRTIVNRRGRMYQQHREQTERQQRKPAFIIDGEPAS
jgi:hypothetical protein